MAAAFALDMVQEKFPVACRWRICHFAQPTRCRDMSMVTRWTRASAKRSVMRSCGKTVWVARWDGGTGSPKSGICCSFLELDAEICWVSQGISCDLMLLSSVIPCYFIVIWNHIIFWMTSIFLTQLTMSVSPAAPAVHEALWKLRSCWRCNDMHVVWLRTAMGFGCCYKNRDQRWMIQFDEITDIYGYLRIFTDRIFNLIILDLDWSCWNHESLFDDVQAPPISHEPSFQFASAVLLFNLITKASR